MSVSGALDALAVVSRDRLGRRAAASPAPEDQDPPARLTVRYGVAIAAAGIVTLVVQSFPLG
jgi:Flp pilus assembly protein protease CpaA